MEKKYQIFISSTRDDLLEERQAAVQAILNAHHIPAGMELFSANDESQWKTIKRWIDDSDLFLLILGGRYGSIEEKSGKSYTQLEFEYAKSHHKPIIALIMHNSYLYTKQGKETNTGRKIIDLKNSDKLENFKTAVSNGRMVAFPTSLDSIEKEILKSLAGYSKSDKLVGWTRSNQAVQNVFSTSRKYQDFEPLLKTAKKELYLTSITGNSFSQVGPTFQELMEKGVRINFAVVCDEHIMKPMIDLYEGRLAKERDMVTPNMNEVRQVLGKMMSENTFRLGIDKGLLKIKKLSTIITYSGIAIDPSENGIIKIQEYVYSATTERCPWIILDPVYTPEWHQRYLDNMLKIWDDAEEIDLSEFDTNIK